MLDNQDSIKNSALRPGQNGPILKLTFSKNSLSEKNSDVLVYILSKFYQVDTYETTF